MTIQKFILGSNSLQGLLFAFSPSSRCHPIDIYSKVNRKKNFYSISSVVKRTNITRTDSVGEIIKNIPFEIFA